MALRRGEIVGGAAVAGFGPTGWIGALGVLAHARRRGIGTALTEAAATWLRDGGAPRSCCTPPRPACRSTSASGSSATARPTRGATSRRPAGRRRRRPRAAARGRRRPARARRGGDRRGPWAVFDALGPLGNGAGFAVERDSRIAGTALRSPWGLGPSVVAEDTEAGLALLSALRRASTGPLTVSLPDGNAEALQALRSWGRDPSTTRPACGSGPPRGTSLDGCSGCSTCSGGSRAVCRPRPSQSLVAVVLAVMVGMATYVGVGALRQATSPLSPPTPRRAAQPERPRTKRAERRSTTTTKTTSSSPATTAAPAPEPAPAQQPTAAPEEEPSEKPKKAKEPKQPKAQGPKVEGGAGRARGAAPRRRGLRRLPRVTARRRVASRAVTWEPEVEELKRRARLRRARWAAPSPSSASTTAASSRSASASPACRPRHVRRDGRSRRQARVRRVRQPRQHPLRRTSSSGIGRIDGRRAVIGGDDFTVRGGAADAAIWGQAGLRRAHGPRTPHPHRPPRRRHGRRRQREVARARSAALTSPQIPRWDIVTDMMNEVPVIAAAMGSVAGLGAARVVTSHWSLIVQGHLPGVRRRPARRRRRHGRGGDKEELGGGDRTTTTASSTTSPRTKRTPSGSSPVPLLPAPERLGAAPPRHARRRPAAPRRVAPRRRPPQPPPPVQDPPGHRVGARHTVHCSRSAAAAGTRVVTGSPASTATPSACSPTTPTTTAAG